MTSAAEAVRGAIARHIATSQRLDEARRTGREAEAAELDAARARRALGTGEARERLEEALSTRALDDAAHAALLAHLGHAAREEVVARRGVRLAAEADARTQLDGREHTLEALLLEARSPRTMPAGAALGALARALERDRGAQREALAEAAEHETRVLARGPALADEAPADLAEHAARFVAATGDAARELLERALHAVGARPDLPGVLRAVAPEPLDAVFPARGRPRRVHAVLGAVELATELGARVTLVPSRALSLHAHVLGRGGRGRVLVPRPELGVWSERGLLVGATEAVVRALAAPSLSIEHAVPARGSVALGLGALFGDLFAERAFLSRIVEGTREREHARLASAAATVLGARLACVPLFASERDEDRRERVAEALAIEPGHASIALLDPPHRSPREAATRARARLGALALVPALRERFDEDWFRNPRFGAVIRGAAARGGLLSLEALASELGAAPAHAAPRAIELVTGATG